MIPGRTYTPEDVVAILRRRIWYLVMPCALFAAGAAILGKTLPDRYQSEAVVLVVPQQVAQALVRTTVTTNLSTRLQSISQQILSRTRLERLMEEFNLYPAERRSGLMEDSIAELRTEIKLSVVKGDAFKVSYQGPDPEDGAAVAARVTSMFIEESLRDRAILAEGTDQFLEVQLDDARRRLSSKRRSSKNTASGTRGTLPTQLGGNLQALQNTQMQIQATLDSLNRDRDQQLLLQRQLVDLQNEAVRPGSARCRLRSRRARRGDARLDCPAARGRPEPAGLAGAALQARLSGHSADATPHRGPREASSMPKRSCGRWAAVWIPMQTCHPRSRRASRKSAMCRPSSNRSISGSWPARPTRCDFELWRPTTRERSTSSLPASPSSRN